MASDRAVGAKNGITAEMLKLAAHPKTAAKTVRWHNLMLTVRPMIDFHETSQFVNSVMGACFDSKHDVAMPEAMDFAIRINTIMRYSNAELPDDTEEQYRIAYGTDLYEEIRDHIQTAQLDAIIKTIELCMMKTI